MVEQTKEMINRIEDTFTYHSLNYSDESMEDRGVVHKPLCYMAKGLEQMCTVHAVYFCKGWEYARGCKIEHDAAVAYGLTIIYEQ